MHLYLQDIKQLLTGRLILVSLFYVEINPLLECVRLLPVDYAIEPFNHLLFIEGRVENEILRCLNLETLSFYVTLVYSFY